MHHPDKWSNASKDVQESHNEQMKQITNAKDIIQKYSYNITPAFVTPISFNTEPFAAYYNSTPYADKSSSSDPFSAYSFAKQMNKLQIQAEKDAFYTKHKSKLPSFINSTNGLSIILILLKPEQCKDLLKMLNNKISLIITSYDLLITILKPLKSEQKTIVLKCLKDNIKTIIQSYVRLNELLQILTNEECRIVLDALKNKIHKIITSGHALKIIFKKLNSEQVSAVVTFLKDNIEPLKGNIETMVQTSWDLYWLLKDLNKEMCEIVLGALKNKMPNIIKSVHDLVTVLEKLNTEQSSAVYESVKDIIPGLINSLYDLEKIFNLFKFKQNSAIYESVKNKITGKIKSADDFLCLIRLLSIYEMSKQVNEACNELAAEMPWILKSTRTNKDFKFIVIDTLNKEQRLSALKMYNEIKLKTISCDVLAIGGIFVGIISIAGLAILILVPGAIVALGAAVTSIGITTSVAATTSVLVGAPLGYYGLYKAANKVVTSDFFVEKQIEKLGSMKL